ncbi:lipopolysaccharide biosynthesis protein [Providencia sp. PROV152]|uniref:lipopolysaccharide biosynthesis protein n=1 Tax=Providencia sp. PROV152 TaxID=2949862 RepID=UPI00234942A7|nr:polysaccharide biosynthesis C-terminal domain-containing protein [Providencia sp. PROV152]
MKKIIITSVLLGIFSKIILILNVIIISKNTSIDIYGEYELLLTTIIVLFPLMTGGVIDAVFRFCYRKQKKAQRIIFSRLFFNGSLIFIILTPIVYYTSQLYFNNYVSTLLVINIYLNFLIELIKQLEKANEKILSMTLIEFFKNIITLALYYFYILKYKTINLEEIISILSIATTACFIILFFKYRIYSYIIFNKKLIFFKKSEISYSLFLMPNTILWWVINTSDKFMLGIFSGITSVAIYSIATKFPSLLTALNRIFLQIWHILIMRNNSTSIWSINYISLYLCVLFSIPIINYIFPYIFDSRYVDSLIYIPFLIIGAFYSIISSLLGGVFIKNKHAKYAFYSTLLAAVINLIGNLILIPIYNIWGCIISTLISLLVLHCTRIYFINKSSDENISIIKNIPLNLLLISYPILFNEISNKYRLILLPLVYLITLSLFILYLKKKNHVI